MVLFFNIIAALGSVGSFIAMLFTLAKIFKAATNIGFKSEKLYGKEADERIDALLKKLPERYQHSFGPDEYKGGEKGVPQFEAERFYYDPRIMPPEWKNLTKTVRYFYEDKETGKTMVRGWRL